MNSCHVCARLSRDETSVIRYPAPVKDDEWAAADLIRGGLIGLALGDALGGLAHSGQPIPTGVRPGRLATGGATQLALFTGEGLLRMFLRAEAKGIGPAWSVIRHALERWSFARGDKPVRLHPALNNEGWPDGWLVRQHVLHRRHDGFGATVGALQTNRDVAEGLADDHVLAKPVNESRGAGAIVRSAPAGLLFGPEHALMVGAVAAAYTHGSSAGYLAPAALARILSGVVRGDNLESAVSDTRRELRDWPGFEEVDLALQGKQPESDEAAATRALRIGLSAARGGEPSPTAAIASVVGEGGTASAVVAGALTGAAKGAHAIEPNWRSAADAIDVLEEMSDAIATAHRGWVMGRRLPGLDYDSVEVFDEDPACGLLWPRFPGW